jgi:hypothetical protein
VNSKSRTKDALPAGPNLNSLKRPWQVTVLGWLFIAAGILGTTYHLWNDTFSRWTVAIVLVRIIAIVGGYFLLCGERWARWLLLAWLAFHVGVSALDSLTLALPHTVLLLVVGYSTARRKDFRFCSSATTVQFTIKSNLGSFVVGGKCVRQGANV